MNDRTIHAAAGEWLIVRYDRAGKWYVEYEPKRDREREHIGVGEAARLAGDWEEVAAGTIYFGAKGGTTFDRLIRKRQAANGEDATPDGERGA